MSSVFSPTQAELAIVSQIFSQADLQKTGILTGEVAVRVFSGAKLPPTILGTIWNISDEEDRGWLPKKGVAIAVRLIGWAQKGEKISKDLVKKPGPLAVIEGINTVSQQNTGMSLPKSPPPGPPTPFPPLTTQDKARFHNMFMKYNPVNGLLSGEKARDIFVKSKLSNEQLMKIWNLADTQDRGSLDSTDFAIGMYFIQGVMGNKISFIPTSLPPGLYHQAGGGQEHSDPVRSHMSGTSGSFSPVAGSFLPQHTGQNQILQPDITGVSGKLKAPAVPAPSFTHSNGHAPAWDVSPTEKASTDRLFDSLDPQKRGYIEGEVAVPFMLDSKLPGEVLAQVWDLADLNSDGRLTRDGFAVAMHLIQKKLAGQDIPAKLPPSLIPPSARVSASGPSPFSPTNAQTHQEPEPATDLFSFDDTPPSSALPQPPNDFGGIRAQPTSPSSSAFAFSLPIVDTDPFSSSHHASPLQDLLSDDGTHGTVPPLHDQSAEIGNLKNQLQSTNRSLTAAKDERSALEQSLADQASQLSSIQTQLSSARAAYETEINLLVTFKERHTTQVAEIQNTQKELIGAESDLSAIRIEKAEIEGAFLRDKEEARELHKRMIETGQQAEALRADVEKLKKEAKQQKGLLAIARKQLSTKESEKAKAEREHAEAVEDLSSITRDKDAVDAELAIMAPSEPKVTERTLSPSDSLNFAASQPIPMTPDLSASSPIKSNNPFERLAMSSLSSQRSPSPFPIQGNPLSPPSLFSTEPTSLPPSTRNESSLELPKPDFLAASSTSDSFSAVQIPASSEPSHVGDDLHAESILSPATANGTDYFITPPTSAKHDSDASLTNSKERFPSLDDLANSIPTIVTDSLPPKHLPTEHADTDLNARLRELDIEESDSDSDSNDEKPLAELAASISKQSATSPSPPPGVDTNNSAPVLAPIPAFDDIFEPDKDQVPIHLPTTATANPIPSHVSIAPEHAEDTSHNSTEPFNVAGVNEFDETMGKMPTSVTPAKFSLDPGFDDDFDFVSASKTLEEPQTDVRDPKKATQKVEFDDIFKNDDIPPAAGSSTPHYSPPDKVTKSGTFDAVFAGFESSPVVKAEDDPVVNSPPVLSRSDEPSMPGSLPPPATLATPPAQTIITSPRPSDIKPISPSRERSPPRMLSPKPRLSSSSSKDNHDKPKEPQTRHSKLSIRLPFGKKKKQQEPMLPSATQYLTTPMEEVRRISTPAGDDDVEPVKQLTAMGFSRTQAVDALERYGYDVQKALNSLLGAQ
ncbi:hypothetical protein BYT27DRAFT_7171751 [Phlegmacium glaucopus]|nr:hypothetical protein BYT27DRAFT_7171751 [Phlegmacium glaucopus]